MTKSANDNMTSLHLIRNEASNWGNWVVIYLCIQTVSQYGHHNSMEDILQGCGDACGYSFALHIILLGPWGGEARPLK